MRVWFGCGRLLLVTILSCFVCTAAVRAATCVADSEAVPETIDGQPLESAALGAFYAAAEGACAWSAADAATLLQAIDALPAQAIDPAPFHPALIRARLAAPDETAHAQGDLLL